MLHVWLSPLGMGLTLTAIRLCFARKLSPGLRRAVEAIIVLCLVAMTPLGANLMVRAIERSHDGPHCSAGEPPAVVVVLSGGFERPPVSPADITALTHASMQRMAVAVEWQKRHAGSRLVLSGGGPFRIPEVAVLRELALQWRVAPEALLLEGRSRTTWESATEVTAVWPPRQGRVGVLTSSLHLPRAVWAFRRAGFDVCSVSAGSAYAPPGGLGYYLPQRSALAKADAALHEMAGLAVYRLRAAGSQARN